MQPSFNCIDLGSLFFGCEHSRDAHSQRLTTYCPLCTKPLPPLATHSSHLHSPSCVGSDGPVFIGCPVLKLGPYWLPLRWRFPLTANPVHGWALFSLCQAASCPDLCCSPSTPPCIRVGGYQGVPEDVPNSLQESLVLTKVLPPFMFPCDFTHQLGREGSRKPFSQPEKEDTGPKWGQGRGAGQGRGGAGKGGPVGSNA